MTDSMDKLCQEMREAGARVCDSRECWTTAAAMRAGKPANTLPEEVLKAAISVLRDGWAMVEVERDISLDDPADAPFWPKGIGWMAAKATNKNWVREQILARRKPAPKKPDVRETGRELLAAVEAWWVHRADYDEEVMDRAMQRFRAALAATQDGG